MKPSTVRVSLKDPETFQERFAFFHRIIHRNYPRISLPQALCLCSLSFSRGLAHDCTKKGYMCLICSGQAITRFTLFRTVHMARTIFLSAASKAKQRFASAPITVTPWYVR